jgi:hypothetical protein
VADAAEGVVDLLALVVELALVGEALPRGAGAGLAAVLAPVRDSLLAGGDELDEARLGVVALGLGHRGADLVSG